MTQQTLGGFWAVLTGAGTGDPFQLGAAPQALVASVVTSAAGTTPSLQVFLDVIDVSGNWVQVAALTAQTAAGTQFAAVTPSSTAVNLTRTARLRWTLSGTSPVMGTAIAVLSA
jgi:hypothetical protein